MRSIGPGAMHFQPDAAALDLAFLYGGRTRSKRKPHEQRDCNEDGRENDLVDGSPANCLEQLAGRE